MAEPSLGTLPWEQGGAWRWMAPCPLGLVLRKPKATFQWARLPYKQELLQKEVRSSRSRQVYCAEAQCYQWLERPREARRAHPEPRLLPGRPC